MGAAEESRKRNPADANVRTRDYFDSILIEERLIDAVKSDTSVEIFGEMFASPIMMPAFSHLDVWEKGEKNLMVEYAAAAKEMNLVNFIGMRENDQMDIIFETGAKTIRIIKPYADRDKIFSQITYAKEHGAFGVGMDIDHIFGNDGDYDLCIGERMAPQSLDMIKEYVKAAAPLPFVIKGVLSVADAEKAEEAGAAAIIVSHHSGRMPYAVPPLVVLQDIKDAIGVGMKIFVDCGIARGADAFKALALGADAVCVGRSMLPALREGGREGLEAYIGKMNAELATIMNYTGSSTVKEIDQTLLYFDN